MGYLKDSYNMSIKPLLNFASPVITPIGNFLTSGSNYDANASAGSNFVNSFSTPSNLFDDTFMSDNMDLTYGGGEVPEFDGISSLPPVVINKNPNELYDPSTFVNDNSPMNEAAGYPNYYKPTEQINPAGVTSADGMMTEPAMYLYPGEAIGIDGVPYRPSAGASAANSGGGNSGGGTAVASAVPSAPVLRTRTFPFTSRTPSGTVYTPDLSAYNDSSLFNYAGPGGLAEYTYGQGLRTDGADYSVFGSPANIANPYFSGQFKEPQGPADAAINMPAVELPEGVQPVTPTEVSADVSMPGFVGGGNPMVGGSLPSDLTYQQTIDEMGIFGPNNPPPSTLFPSPGQTTANVQNTVAGNIAGSPDNSMMDNQAAANLAMGNRLGYEAGMSRVPTDMQNYLDDFEARGIRDRTQQIMDYAAQNNNMIDGITIFDEGDPRQILQDAILNPETRKEYRPIYGGLDGIPLDDSFMMSDGPLARNTGKPFRPEGVEGEDFYQDVTGNFFSMEDDLGTQPLGPNTRGSRGTIDIPSGPNVRGTRGNIDIPSGPNVRGTKGDTIPADIPAFLDYNISRMNDKKAIENAVNAKDSQLQEQLDSRPRYEREGTEELASNRMVYLDNAYDAIDAKYAGSTTTASQQAELVEVLNANLNSFGNDAGRENAALAREQQSMKQANATPFIPSYARENEGQDTGESLFQNVAEDIPLSVFNPIDRVVMQAEAQAAQVAAAKAQAAADSRAAEKAAAAAEARRNPPPPPPRVTPANVASIFSPPAGPPNMAQIKPMVARTQNNMTVPVMRDSAMDRRYGGPMRFGR